MPPSRSMYRWCRGARRSVLRIARAGRDRSSSLRCGRCILTSAAQRAVEAAICPCGRRCERQRRLWGGWCDVDASSSSGPPSVRVALDVCAEPATAAAGNTSPSMALAMPRARRSAARRRRAETGHTDALQCEGRSVGRVVTWERHRMLASRVVCCNVRRGVHGSVRGFADDMLWPRRRRETRTMAVECSRRAKRSLAGVGSWTETHRMDVVRVGLGARARWGSVGGGRIESGRQASVRPRRRSRSAMYRWRELVAVVAFTPSACAFDMSTAARDEVTTLDCRRG